MKFDHHHNAPDQSHPTNANVTGTMGSVFDVARMIIGLLCVISNHLFHHNANRQPRGFLPLIKEILMMMEWNWIQIQMDGKVTMRQ